MLTKRLMAVFTVVFLALMLSCSSAKEEWCPRCHGEGKIEVQNKTSVLNPRDHPFYQGDKIKVNCPVCKGKGKVAKLN